MGHAPECVAESGLPKGHDGRVTVDRSLRLRDHPQMYASGDPASGTEPRFGHVLTPLAKVAL